MTTVALSFAAVSTAGVGSETRVGFNLLYSTHNETWDETCHDISSAKVPAYVKGTFLLPSLGQFELGGYSFEGIFDPFGKLARFTFTNDSELCVYSTMMDSAYYNDSIAMGKPCPNLFLLDTSPPLNYTDMQKLEGPQDNLFVNSYEIGGHFRVVSDTVKTLEFDPKSLRITGNVTWADKLDHLVLPLGSAHQLPDPQNPGCIIDVHPQTGVLHKEVIVYRICDDKPYERVKINSYPYHYMPYFHAWGLTSKHLVLPQMHFTIDMMAVFKRGATMNTAFQPRDMGKPTTVKVVPLDGSAPIDFSVPGDIFYTHSMNTFENATSITWDFIFFGANPFAGAGRSSLSLFRNKTRRDNIKSRGIAKRLVLHLSGPLKGTHSLTTLGFENDVRGTDFPTINDNYLSKEYCYFYANEWYHDRKAYADMAISKWNVCETPATQKYFYRPNHYPSEPKFIPSGRDGAAEDEGVLIFSLLNGVDETSSLLIIDAQTFDVILEQRLPHPVGFTTHGEFYRNLVF